MSIDYSKLEEITVKSQDELDAIPLDFKGKIYIQFGTYYTPAIVRNNYYRKVVARGNSSVEAWGNSSVEAWGNSSVVARVNSSVEAWGNSSVEARENSSVVARENSSVVAWGNSSVVARGNTQVVDRLLGGRIEITGNARKVYMPKTIDEYCTFYGIEHTKKKGKFFKAVHKSDEKYFSDKDSDFEYIIGKKARADRLDDDVREDCGHGIHISYLGWCLDYGKEWKDLAIIEVEADLDGIIIPNSCPGKVRCLEVKVIREIPLEECGIYGKMIANRLNKEREKDA